MSIEARALTKRYGEKTAVDDLLFTVRPGMVTGFLGPNGAGKTTTMRLILGLDYPTGGSVTVNGKPFSGLYSPMREVDALLGALMFDEPVNGLDPEGVLWIRNLMKGLAAEGRCTCSTRPGMRTLAAHVTDGSGRARLPGELGGC